MGALNARRNEVSAEPSTAKLFRWEERSDRRKEGETRATLQLGDIDHGL